MQKDLPIWYPFTNQKLSDLPIKIRNGKDEYLYDENGKAYIDAISSWWVNTYGHRYEPIVTAIKNQLDSIEHLIFAGFTHNPAEELANSVLNLLDNKFDKVFFSDNGSTAVEVALKMSLQYFYNKGETRNKVMAFNGSYHGDTFGAMALGERGTFNKPFEELFFDVQFFDYPSNWIGNEDIQTQESDVLSNIEQYIEQNKGSISSIIIEPLVQGAGGMKMCRTEFLNKLISLAKEQDIIVIFDEIMTGFGRTESHFAFQQLHYSPDIICLSKGLTGGFLPLSLTLCTNEIFEPFYSDDFDHTFFHGHSYTANPLGCVAAIESVKALPKFETQRKAINQLYHKRLSELLSVDMIEKIRIQGTILAFDIKSTQKTEYSNPIGSRVKSKLIDKGFLIRPLGNTIYILPPYCISANNLNGTIDNILSVIDAV